MRREAHIPLFLWIATALVVHALGGGGATSVANRLAETLDIKSFASEVRRQASYAGPPVEVTLLSDDDELDELPQEPALDKVQDSTPLDEPEPAPDSAPEPEPIKPKPEPEKKPDAPIAKQDKPEKKPDAMTAEQAKITPPVVMDNRRVAVDQDVLDKNQEDNETAEFAAEHANRVKEQTRASVTASDGATSRAQMGGPTSAASPDVGNADNDRFGQTEASEGRKDTAPGDPSEARRADRAASTQKAEQEAQPASAQPSSAGARDATASPQGQLAQQAQAALEAQSSAPETMTAAEGAFAVARAQREQAEAKAREARQAIPGPTAQKPPALFGLGALGRTKNGINLNLSLDGARRVIGVDQLAQVRKKDGERRLSQHRGSWQSVGLERWRPALENYVANVKPGNQTALNTARVPFAKYLNEIHQRLHELFADRFLGQLDQLPKDHPLNNHDMSTHLEIALSKEDGRVVRMGITKSSGVTAFDVGALDSVDRAAPYGPPPSAILSSDGNVYLHWEFHRRPEYACSTYFARPFIIDLGQTPAVPRVDPPPPPKYENEAPPPEKKSGALEEIEPPQRTNG